MGEKASKESKKGSDMTKGSKAPKHSKGLEGSKESKGGKESKGSKTTKMPGLDSVGTTKKTKAPKSKGAKSKSSNAPSSSDDTPTTATCPFDVRRALASSSDSKSHYRSTSHHSKSKSHHSKSHHSKSHHSKSKSHHYSHSKSHHSRSKSHYHSHSKSHRALKGSKSAKSTAAPAVPLDDVWGQDPGTQIVISLASNPTYCIQPAGLSAGQGLEAVPCTYNDGDAYTIDAYGQLHTSDPDLCVTGVGSDLVLDVCDVCGAVFQFDSAGFTIKAVYADTTLFWTTVDGDLFLLEEMEMSGIQAKQMMIEDTQEFLVISLFAETSAPTLTHSPTALDTDPPTSSSPPSSM